MESTPLIFQRAHYILLEHNSVLQELAGHVFKDLEWHKRAFLNEVPPKDDILKFLAETPLYDNENKRWKHMPNVVKNESSDLIDPYRDIIASIISKFGDSSKRSVRGTREDGLRVRWEEVGQDHREKDKLRLAPDITIAGNGDVFSPDTHLQQTELRELPSYLDCVAAIQIKQHEFISVNYDVIQTAIYARQCFLQQENRRFVYCLLLTEQSVYLFLYDRSGCHHSIGVNVHTEATDFVRLILGVSSANDEQVGLDPSIFWDPSKRGRFMKTHLNGEPDYLLLESSRPYSYYAGIRGRGTACWLATGAISGKVVIKDSWHTVHERHPESEYLNSAKSITGVVKMNSFQNGTSTSALRGIPPDKYGKDPRKDFEDRGFSRIFTKYAGRPLCDFSTRKEVLVAMRDAIAIHQQLWNAKILHRDITPQNIIIGPTTNSVGSRGMLADLDEASWLEDDAIPERAHYTIGTRAFQSIIVLQTCTDDQQQAMHDYRDDLESFFYVLCYLVVNDTVRRTANSIELRPKLAGPWQHSYASFYKDELFRNDIIWKSLTRDVSPCFGEFFVTLLNKYRDILKPLVIEKLDLAQEPEEPEEQRKTYKELKPLAEKHYPLLLEIFDEAINECESEQPGTSTVLVARSSVKRGADAMDNIEYVHARKKRG